MDEWSDPCNGGRIVVVELESWFRSIYMVYEGGRVTRCSRGARDDLGKVKFFSDRGEDWIRG